MKSVEIDLDVNKAIEAGRTGFEESPNQILRRLLGIDLRPRDADARAVPRAPRSNGAYSTTIGSATIEANSLKELLRRAILLCEKLQPGFIERLSHQSTPKGRHIVATTVSGLYPKSPQLMEFGERLDGDWWYDTNVGRGQVLAYLKQFAQLLQLASLPVLHKRLERTVLTLEDLGLA